MFGGACSVGIGVSDLERSVPFYRDFLGFDVMLTSVHESFSGLVDEVSGRAGTRVRSCLLSANAQGETMIELFETTQTPGQVDSLFDVLGRLRLSPGGFQLR